MNELAQYLLENILVDFEGEVTTESVRAFLRKDNSQDGRACLQKIIEENGIDDLLLALADIMTAEISKAITPAKIREHLVTYSEY